MSDEKIPDELPDLLDVIYRNANEDRVRIIDLYNEIKGEITNLHQYEEHGRTLSKLLECASKPNAQLLELAKHRQTQEDNGKVNTSFDDDERDKIFKEIKK